jgi:hypothetical protein
MTGRKIEKKEILQIKRYLIISINAMNKNCLDLDLNKPTSISIFLSKIDDT